MSPARGHLTLARAGDVPAAPLRPSRVPLRPAVRLQVEQARQCVMELDGRTAGADLPRAMYLLGVVEHHARTLLDVRNGGELT